MTYQTTCSRFRRVTSPLELLVKQYCDGLAPLSHVFGVLSPYHRYRFVGWIPVKIERVLHDDTYIVPKH